MKKYIKNITIIVLLLITFLNTFADNANAEEQNARDFYKKRPSFCKKTGFVRFYPPKSSKTAVRFPQIVIFCAAGTPELIFRRQNGILINENNGQRKEIRL